MDNKKREMLLAKAKSKLQRLAHELGVEDEVNLVVLPGERMNYRVQAEVGEHYVNILGDDLEGVLALAVVRLHSQAGMLDLMGKVN